MSQRFIPRHAAAVIAVAAVAGASAAVGETQPLRGTPVTVRLAVSNNGADVADGGVAGRGTFSAKGGIRDHGKVVVYRTMKAPLITLRFVASGAKGRITFLVKIDASVGTSRWSIASGTRRYRGLHGKGTERENATYTVSTLTGSVWR